MGCGIRGKQPYRGYFICCCFQDLFENAFSNLVQFSPSFFSRRFVKFQGVATYSSADTAKLWEKSRLIFFRETDLQLDDNLSRAVHDSLYGM